MAKLEFCRRLVHLDRKPISFDERPYLPAIYDCRQGNLVLRCSRQTEKSTLVANTILYEVCTSPGIRILLVCPRYEQGRVFCRSRLFPSLEQSPLIRRLLIGKHGRRLQMAHTIFNKIASYYASFGG